MRDGSKNVRTPRPSQRRHAPAGLLNEKIPRLQLGNRVSAHVAGKAGREDHVVAVTIHRRENGAAVGERQRGLEGLGEGAEPDPHGPGNDPPPPRSNVSASDRVRSARPAPHRRPIDTSTDESLGFQSIENPYVLTLAVADKGGEQHEALAERPRHDRIDHLGDGLGFEHDPVLGAARLADAGKEQPQVVMNLGDGPDRGAWIVRRGLLLDRYRGRQYLDMLDVGLLHHREELARIRRERFDIAPLPLGIDGVERERRLARS